MGTHVSRRRALVMSDSRLCGTDSDGRAAASAAPRLSRLAGEQWAFFRDWAATAGDGACGSCRRRTRRRFTAIALLQATAAFRSQLLEIGSAASIISGVALSFATAAQKCRADETQGEVPLRVYAPGQFLALLTVPLIGRFGNIVAR
ncbi:hypothetical protein B0H15DRAFT_805765 [Mycena belliarum]|uniref:Uncharacterized protein n=1 Tax=Mycena belliarum TaxID=1033014 RepID=A0AAD6TVR7_9AGAR|nr:hypothetical protein B0H15DRAFT_805765 [Mycena belliae]